MFPWFSPLSDRSPVKHTPQILRSAAMAQVPICWLQESEKQLYWAPQSACQFHQNVHCWLESEWFANGVVCFGGVRIVCIDKSYILYTVYKYNLQFCCIWWLLLCSCHSCAGCSCFFCYYWCVFPTRFLGQHLPRKSTLTTSEPLKAKVFGMINCSLCWMVGDCGLRDSCKERKIRKKIKHGLPRKTCKSC